MPEIEVTFDEMAAFWTFGREAWHATFGGFDLGCTVGIGKTPLDAIERRVAADLRLRKGFLTMIERMEQIVAHLGAALMQVVETDDKIIIIHVADAHALAVNVLRELRQMEKAA